MSVLFFLLLAAGLILNGTVNGFNLTVILQVILSGLVVVMFIVYKKEKLFFRKISQSKKDRLIGSAILAASIAAAVAIVYFVGLTQPESAEVRNVFASQKASALINAGEYEKAVDILENRDLDGTLTVNDRINLGSAYLRLGETRLAKSQYDLALRESPANSVCCFNLALAFMEDGDFQMAMNYFEKAGQLNPQLWVSFLYRGAILRMQGAVRPALEMYIKVDRRNPGQAHIKYMIARLTYELNDLENARLRIETALAMDQQADIREELEAMLAGLNSFQGGD